MITSVPIKLGAFALMLAAVFGLAYLTGTQSQALLSPPPIHPTGFGGLSNTEDGYAMRLAEPTPDAGDDQFIPITVTGPNGDALPVRAEDDPRSHLHLIAFRHDFTGFQHIYPEQGEGSTWWALLNLTPGPWHVILELTTTGGRDLALATDFTVPGAYAAEPLPAPATSADAGGLTVTRTGALSTRIDGETGVTVDDHGNPVTDLQESHDSIGHAVIIRPGDLGYLHLHSVGTGSGPRLSFSGGVPEKGSYVMFVEFFRAEQLHVATFTVDVTR